MNLRQLEIFIAVAETLHFTHAAERLFISQTAVTKQIHALETDLGAPLFLRTNRRVSLTPAGQVFLNESRAILARADEAVARVQLASTGISGVIRIGFVRGYEKTSFTDLILDFHREYPNVYLSFVRDDSEALSRQLTAKELDLVFRIRIGGGIGGGIGVVSGVGSGSGTVGGIGGGDGGGSGEASSAGGSNVNGAASGGWQEEGLHGIPLDRYPLVVAVHPTHPLASRKSVRREELAGDAPLLLDSPHAPASRPARDHESVLLMVSASMGIAILPAYAAKYLERSRDLVFLSLEGEDEQVGVEAVWRDDGENPALGLFVRRCLASS